MLDANLKTQLKAYLERVTQPIELVASLDDRPGSQEMRELLEDIAGLLRQDQPAPGRAGRPPALVFHQPRRPRHGRALRRHPDGPRIHFAGAGAAAGRRPPAEGGGRRHRADPGAGRRLRLRDLHVADLPQLPRRGAGAEPDGGAEPARAPRGHRRRAVQGRGRSAPDHGRAHRLPERAGLRQRPHGAGRDPGQGRQRRRRARRREAGRQGALRRAHRRRRPGRRRGGRVCRTQGHPHRHRGRALRRPDAGYAGDRELHLGARDRRPEICRRAGGARAHLRRGSDERPARRRAGAGGGARRPGHGAPGQRRRAEEPHRGPGHRRALEECQRAGRAGVPHQGRGLLPALRRPAVQGQEGRRHRRRQFGRRGRHRPGRRGGARHAAGIRRPAQGRCGAGEQAQEPAQRQHPHQRADDRDHRRRPEGQRPALQGPRHAARSTRWNWPASSCRSAWCPTPSG